jgi:hypothetical protein
MAEIVVKLVNGELAGKTAQTISKEINAAALAAKKAEIGTKDWITATQRLDKAKKLQEDYRKQVEATTAASEQLKEAWNKLPGAQYFNQVTQSFAMLKSGVGGLVSKFGVLKTAVAATGIGALIIAITTLVTWFKKTDEGATLLSGIMRGLGIVFDTVFGKIIDMAKGLGEFFTGKKSIKQGLKDLVDFIGNNLLNRLKAFIVIWDGIKKLDLKKVTDGVIQLGTGITDATDKMIAFGKSVADAVNEGIDFEKQMDAIEDRARELSVLNAETEKEVSRLLLQSKNVALTYQERIDLLDKASAIELKNHQAQLANAIALEKLRAQEIEDNKKRNIQNDELDQQLTDAQIARINLQKESISLQEKIENRRAALLEKQAAEQEKEEAARLKARTEAWELYYKNLKDLEDKRIAAMPEGREKDLAELKLSLQREIEALDVHAPLYAERLAATTELARQKRSAINDKWNKSDEAKQKEQVDKEIKTLEDAANHENYLLLLQLYDRNITRSQFDQLAEQNKKKSYEAELKLLEEKGMQETALYEQISAKIIDIELGKQEKLKDSRQKTFDAAVSFGNALLDSQIANINRENAAGEARLAEIEKRQGKESAAYKQAQAQLLRTQRENFEKKKRLEKAQIKINALAEIAGIIKSAVEIGGVYGIVVGALLSATTLIRANSAIQEVNAQKFKYGGIPDGVLRGPSHEQGGIPLNAEGEEIILTKGVYRNPALRSMASAINVAGGGRQFAAGGPSNPFSGSSGTAGSSGNAAPIVLDTSNLEAVIMGSIAAINSRIDRIEVHNVMTKPDGTGYNDRIETVNKIKADADV